MPNDSAPAGPAMAFSLDWYPRSVAGYLRMTAVMTLEQEGALNRLEAVAWSARDRGDPPGTVPNTPVALTRLLGAEWEAFLPFLLGHFVVHPERPDLLLSERLRDLFEQQESRYRQRVDAGNKSAIRRQERAERLSQRGKKRARNPKPHKDLNETPNSSQRKRDLVGVSTSFENPSGGGSSKELPPPTGSAPFGAAAGRGGATSAPPSPEGLSLVTDAQRIRTERPTREQSNAPPAERDDELVAAERWRREEPHAAHLIREQIDLEWALVAEASAQEQRDPGDRASWELGIRTTAMRAAFRRAHSRQVGAA